jgi:transposase
MSNISVLEKKVDIGIDVHKDTYSMTAICEKKVLKRLTVSADPEIFARSLKKWFPDAGEINTAYEAGFSGFVLHRHLVAHGINSIVVNPASIAIASKDKVKNDLMDSKKIAIELADNRLTGIYVPSIDEQGDRMLSRTRQQIADHRGRVSRQIKSALEFLGHREHDDTRAISSRYIRHLKASLPAKPLASLEFLFELWIFLTKQLFEFRKLYRKGRPNDPEKQQINEIYKSVPGVGDISARVFTDELGDMSRFKNTKALASYLGLTPTEYSSGNSIRKGHITRQGSGCLRKLLVESAWRATKLDAGISRFFERIAASRGKKRAIVATARNLAIKMRACLKAKTPYQISKPDNIDSKVQNLVLA